MKGIGSQDSRSELSATELRNFRSFLLVEQFEAEAIGARIAQARKEAGLRNQQELADLLGVTLRTIQNYEAGVVIPYPHFRRIEELTGKNLGWFLRGDENEVSPHSAQSLIQAAERLAEAADELQSAAADLRKAREAERPRRKAPAP